ncbi:hypothetical protein [Mycolicibacterium setense]
MSICENFSELARELRTAAGTVLSIVGSCLEADARARVDEVGPQWLTEFEAENDGLECACGPCPLRDEDVCDEAEAEAADEYCTSCQGSGIGYGQVPDGRWMETDCGHCDGSGGLPGKSDPGAVSTPAPGEQVLEDDLAAHIMGDFVSGQDVDPLTATLIDALSSRIASALLTDFDITRK